MRRLYTEAKALRSAQFWIVLPMTVVIAVLALNVPQLELLNVLWAALAFVVLRYVVEPRTEALLKSAARIQEAFDCEVLELPANPEKTGCEPDPEEVIKAARRHDGSVGGRDDVKDWYEPAEIAALPLHLARIVCLRQNCRWDGELRRRFVVLVTIASAGVGLLVLGVPTLLDWTLRDWWLFVFAPLFPLLELGWSEIRAQNDAAARVDNLKERLAHLWRDALLSLTPTNCTQRTRDLQDVIFEHRSSAQPVPDRLYNRLRQKIQRETVEGITAMMREATAAMPQEDHAASGDAPTPAQRQDPTQE
jgi:hypothetical protein